MFLSRYRLHIPRWIYKYMPRFEFGYSKCGNLFVHGHHSSIILRIIYNVNTSVILGSLDPTLWWRCISFTWCSVDAMYITASYKFVRASFVNLQTLPRNNKAKIKSNLISHIFTLYTNFFSLFYSYFHIENSLKLTSVFCIYFSDTRDPYSF